MSSMVCRSSKLASGARQGSGGLAAGSGVGDPGWPGGVLPFRFFGFEKERFRGPRLGTIQEKRRNFSRKFLGEFNAL